MDYKIKCLSTFLTKSLDGFIMIFCGLYHFIIVFTKLQYKLSQPVFTCSKSKMETPEKCLKSVQV